MMNLEPNRDLIADIRYSTTVTPIEWMARHKQGHVPDLLPYGLDKLSKFAVETRARTPPRKFQRSLGRIESRTRYDWRHGAKQTDCDAVLCWDERVGVPASLFVKAPVVTGVIWGTEKPNTVLVKALGRSAAVWALSSAQIPTLIAMGVARAEYVPMGIDADFFSPEPYSPTGTVVSVGNDRHRDHGCLLSAFSLLAKEGLTLKLISRHASPLPGIDNVTVSRDICHVDVRTAYYSASLIAIALKPNLHVSGITAVLEAMACGRPVVVSDTPGMAGYITHGVTGLLVPPGDRIAMANAIRSLIRDPDRAREIGAEARRRVEDRFTTHRQAMLLANLLHESRQ